MEAYILQNIGITAVMVRNIFYVYHFSLLSLNKRCKNKWPPKKEVIAPIGKIT
ncbi:hypothetical protein HMPREF9554_00285 [Treponema phagedenis F0421]|nr:hypothetical protein HMPREF9554_00285 [Treponema phagedenis F0421]